MKALFSVVIALIISFNEAHVRLDFPPAHLPNYDFLDNARTEGPCGTRADNRSRVTTFMSGATFELSFRLAYAHRGGLGVRLLHSNGSLAHVLLPSDGNETYLVRGDDGTVQSVPVTLPSGFECERCTMQLIRNAAEWFVGRGAPYLFWSCAEVSILSSPATNCPNDCGRGTCNNGACQCPRLYTGAYCQIESEYCIRLHRNKAFSMSMHACVCSCIAQCIYVHSH
jgi:hypothetical protein